MSCSGVGGPGPTHDATTAADLQRALIDDCRRAGARLAQTATGVVEPGGDHAEVVSDGKLGDSGMFRVNYVTRNCCGKPHGPGDSIHSCLEIMSGVSKDLGYSFIVREGFFNQKEKCFFRVINGEFSYACRGQWVPGLPPVQREDRRAILAALSAN